ncbi:MAG: PilT/PilU family type 4a pilus ATPase [Candidatus Brocadiaceae bacterium]|nr:PilT/PilU family type 4a pilus ATPase [Candidatus Brocadiaceae bacterium]
MIQIDKLLSTAIKREAEDIVLTVGRPPMLRLNGALEPLATQTLTSEDTTGLVKSIASERYQQELQEMGSADFGFNFQDKAAFRVGAFRQQGRIAIVLRMIPSKIRTFSELGLGPVVQELLFRPRGLVLVTGPTGSGKTTTLATMVDHINNNRKVHILTIEDPIEYRHPHRKSIVSQREVGVDVPAFGEALRRALRESPDVILVGEMRDLDSTRLAISAAETGHLVLSTVHTQSAQSTVERIIDEFPPQQQAQIRIQLANSLLAVLAQTLVPRLGGGMVAAYEVLLVTNAVRHLIRDNKTFRIDSTIQTGRDRGMQLLDDHLLQLYKEGIIERTDVLTRCRYPEEVSNSLKALEV